MDCSSAGSTTLANARILAEYLDAHGESSISSIACATGISPPDVKNAIRYALDHGMAGRTRYAESGPHERVRYYATGQQVASKAPEFFFDALLQAWGLASTPPAASSAIRGRRFVCPDTPKRFSAREVATA